MFGIFYAIFVGLNMLRETIEDGLFTQEKRNEAINEGKETYFDANANMHYIKNGNDIACYKTHNLKNWHEILVEFKKDNIIKDYTQEALSQMDIDFKNKYRKAKEDAYKLGKKYVEVSGIYFPKDYVYINGKTERVMGGMTDRRCKVRYKIENDAPYFLKCYSTKKNGRIRYFGWSIFYCDVDKFEIKINESHGITEMEYKMLGGWMPETNSYSY